MRSALLIGLVFGLFSVALSQNQCDKEFACDEHGHENGLIEKIHEVWSIDICRAHCQDMYEFGCRWFTHWSDPGEHHAECWLFESCGHRKPECHDHNCISGPADCDMSCRPLPMDNDGVWSCFPEVPEGQSVPQNTHCVFECGNETSSHVCVGGGWDHDVNDVKCDIKMSCPPLGEIDHSNGGMFHCHPHVEPDMEADEGTYCVFECDGHETGETECDFHGNWFPDPGTFQCHDPTTPPPTTAPPTTAAPTTTPPPPPTTTMPPTTTTPPSTSMAPPSTTNPPPPSTTMPPPPSTTNPPPPSTTNPPPPSTTNPPPPSTTMPPAPATTTEADEPTTTPPSRHH